LVALALAACASAAQAQTSRSVNVPPALLIGADEIIG
jgi:hypothetical protein